MFGRLLSGLFLVILVTGCGLSKSASVALPPSTPEELVLYAIDGLVNEPENFESDDKHFRGYVILGKVEIADSAARQDIVKAIETGFKESDDTVASCFWPRHGVRVVTKGNAVDYVICYECLQAYIFTGDERTFKPTAPTHQAVLTAPLTAAGIKLAPSIEEKVRRKD
jgi:hypothetical protein